MSWRLAKSLEVLRSQVNAAYPKRSKASDGTIRWYSGDMKLTTWQKIQKIGWTKTENGCLEYNGYRNENGYGQFRDANKLLRVHRIAYSELIGSLANDEVVMHLCDNPACSEPTHLKKGTQEENIKDMWSKNRAHKSDLKTCINGHDYPIDRPRAIDKNRCRECAKERNRRYHARKKLASI